MESMYLTIVEWFIKDECMKNDAKSLKHREVTNVRKLEYVYFGPKVMARIETMNSQSANLKTFRLNCFNFLVQLADEIHQRFLFQRDGMQALKLMEFIEQKRLKNINSIAACALCYFKPKPKSILYRMIRNSDL